jgi:capsular polysaccharide biosynthesis protein
MDSKKIISVSLIEPVQKPLNPISPKKLLNLVLGLFLGAFGSLGLAFFLHYFDDSLETVEDVEETLQLPVLASIPELKAGPAAG